MRKGGLIYSIVLATAYIITGCGSMPQNTTTSETQTAKIETNTQQEQDKKDMPDGYPKKPIKVIVPWDAGGGTDVFVRTMATGADKYLGQPLNIVNRGGAGGTIATTEFLNEKGDGYSVIFEAVGVFSTQPKLNSLTYSEDDFKPIIGTSVDPVMLVTTEQSGVKTFEEFVEYTKNNTVNFGYTGTGSIHHIANYALFGELGADINGVNYTGGGELLAAMMGDHVQFGSLHPVNIISYEDSETFIPLLIYSNERIAHYPDVPTAKEKGYDFDFEVWKFIAAPKDTPDEIINFLYEGFDNMLKDPKIKKILEEGGSIMMEENDPAFVTKKLKDNVIQTGEILDKLGLSNY